MCGEWTGRSKRSGYWIYWGNPQSLALFIEGKPAARLPGSGFLDELESMIRQQAQIKEQERAELIAHSTDTALMRIQSVGDVRYSPRASWRVALS